MRLLAERLLSLRLLLGGGFLRVLLFRCLGRLHHDLDLLDLDLALFLLGAALLRRLGVLALRLFLVAVDRLVLRASQTAARLRLLLVLVALLLLVVLVALRLLAVLVALRLLTVLVALRLLTVLVLVLRLALRTVLLQVSEIVENLLLVGLVAVLIVRNADLLLPTRFWGERKDVSKSIQHSVI